MKVYHFIEKIWYPPLSYRSFVYYLFWIFSLPFLFLVKLKYFLYKKTLLKSSSFTKPVIVVGNISVGGTGKTPFISSLVKLLKENGIKPGIVSRGYQSNLKSYPHQVSDFDSALSVGDEAFMQYSKFDLPIVIDANRSRAVKFLIDNNNVDLIISDDGLQHYKMQRDLEIVLIDSSRAFGNQLIMPFGPLREPVSRCKSIDLLIRNGRHSISNDIEKLVNDSVDIVPKNFVNLKTNKTITLSEFDGVSVIAVAGIGNPNRFYSTLKSHCNILTTVTFKDHHQYTETDFNDLSQFDGSKYSIVMTEKDAVKCKSFAKANWYYLDVDMQFSQKLNDSLLSKVQKLIERKI